MAEITDITRHAILDDLQLTLGFPGMWGRSDELTFLGKLFDLEKLPSYDSRFKNAHGDIHQHRVNNYDWPDNWWIGDARINIAHVDDATFLCFLSELVHPLVRPDQSEARALAERFNEHLRRDGFEIVQIAEVSGRTIYGGGKMNAAPIPALAAAKEKMDAKYIHNQIRRMEEAIETDPELAIGTAKEFLETICRTVLNDRGLPLPADDDMPALLKAAIDAVPTVPDDLDEKEATKKTIRIFVNNLGSMGRSVAELRNAHGTGHGKDANHKGLAPRHVRLIVNAATAVGVFLFECHTA